MENSIPVTLDLMEDQNDQKLNFSNNNKFCKSFNNHHTITLDFGKNLRIH